MKIKYPTKKTKRIILIIALFISILIFLNSFIFFKLWTSPISLGGKTFSIQRIIPVTYRQIQQITYQFDIFKPWRARGFKKESDSLNINLSSDDIKAFQKFYLQSTQSDGLRYGMNLGQINRGFLVDDINYWRKAEVEFPGLGSQKIKIKIHGTSPTPILESVSFSDRLKWSTLKKISENDFDISRGGYAFKLKIPSDGDFYKNKRRLNLLTPWDSWNIVQNGFNRYLKEFGVISTSGTVKRVFINGREIGPYLVVENIDKELLERDFQITNFALFKTNDDWNKSLASAHISTTDFTSFDMEQSGVEETSKIAAAKLKKLMEAIYYEDLDLASRLIDVDNLAKIAAIINVTGTIHPILGDNTKYIYDFATGRFKLVYRLESAISKTQSSMPAKFDHKKFAGGETHPLITMFMKDESFIITRNQYLQDFVNQKDNIISIIESDQRKFSSTIAKTKFPTNIYEYDYLININNLKTNLKRIENYLNYTKIYVTAISNNEGTLLEILNDSYTETKLENIITCDDRKIRHMSSENIPKSIYLNNGLIDQIKSVYKVKLSHSCISYLEFSKPNTGLSIDSKNTYINYSVKESLIETSGLNQINFYITTSENSEFSDIFNVKTGNYKITKDLIFDMNTKIIFEPGVVLTVDSGVSVLIRGDFSAIGTQESPIKIISSSENLEPFGAFAIIGSPSNLAEVELEHFILDGGSEAVLDGTYFSSQLSIHYSNTYMNKAFISNSLSDDGLNIKFSNVTIDESSFYNNFADQIDLDYSNGSVSNSKFYFNGELSNKIITDGLDISGSRVRIINNIFEGMTDKGISVGESSVAHIKNNKFHKNNSAIAIKDNSNVCIEKNSYSNNAFDYNIYIKKKMYEPPKITYSEIQEINIKASNVMMDGVKDILNQECNNWVSQENL